MIEPRKLVKAGRRLAELSIVEFARQAPVSPFKLGEFERGRGTLTYYEQKAVGELLVKMFGGTVRDFFPGFIPRDGDKQGLETPQQDSAGNRANNDGT